MLASPMTGRWRRLSSSFRRMTTARHETVAALGTPETKSHDLSMAYEVLIKPLIARLPTTV
jgi:hypothetical protein